MTQQLIRFFTEHFYIPLYLLTWIIAVFRYKRFFDTPLKYLPMLIIYTFFTELLGYFIKYNDEFLFFSDDRYAWHNVIIYNIYQLIFFLFFYRVYHRTLKKSFHRIWSKYGSYLCILAYIVNSIIANPLHNRLSYAHIVGSFILIFILVMYFLEKRSEESLYPQKHNLLFWVSMGLFAFYLIFPLVLIFGNISIDVQFYLRRILLSLIGIMYGCFIIGLLIGKRQAFR